MQRESLSVAAIVISFVFLGMGFIGGYLSGRANQGKVYQRAIEKAERMEKLIGDLSHSLAGARENYLRAEADANRLAENLEGARGSIDYLEAKNNRLRTDNFILTQELGKLERELNDIRGDLGRTADDIGAVIDGAEADEK